MANERNQPGLSAATLYRFLRAHGLTERQLLLDTATAHKKYEAQFSNQIWQSDMLFGPGVARSGGGKQQVFLQAALDDASRLIPHAQFYPNQGLDAFLDCLRQAIAARGLSETGSGLAGAVTHRTTGGRAARLDRAGTVVAARHPVCGRRAQGGQSLLVANLALGLAAGKDRAGFRIPAARRVLVCQFELPTPQFVGRLAAMRRSVGSAADQNLLVDTRAIGHLLSAPQGLSHFLNAAHQAAAEVIVLDPLYSTHDQDENDTRSMVALCQSLLRLRDASQAALIVVHHVRKSIGRDEIGSTFRGSSALHGVGDSYLLLTRPSVHLAATVELRFQFRYAAPPEPRLLQLDPHTLCFSAAGLAPSKAAVTRKKVEQEQVTKALTDLGRQARYNQLRQQVMEKTECSKRTAQLAIAEACRQGSIVRADGQYNGCRFKVRATLRRVAPAWTLPRGEPGPEAGDGSAAQTCSSVHPAGT